MSMKRRVSRPPEVPTYEKPLRTPRRDFANLIASTPPVNGQLPLTHLTDGYSFREILERKRLEPIACKNFNEALVYLFYGRPAYRPNQNALPNSLEMFFPICIVLNGDEIQAKRIHPFDSGAYHLGLLKKFMHPRMLLEDFELEPNQNAPRQLISFFYNTLDNYFDDKPKVGLKMPALAHEAESYYQVLCSIAKEEFDERVTTIEIQSKTAVELKEAACAIILPDIFADNVDILAAIKSMGVEIIPYDTRRRAKTEVYVAKFYDHVREFYKRKKFL